jgi:hypothetical protein
MLFPKVLVVVPAFNEEATVAEVVRDIRDAGYPDVLVVEDAGSDNTAKNAAAAGAKVLRLPMQLGAWGAMQTGFRMADRMGCDYVVTMDADGQHKACDVGTLLSPLLGGAVDVVVGSCTERGSWARKFAWRLFRTVNAAPLQDLTSGFRAYNKKAVSLLATKEATMLDYQDVGVILMLLRSNLTLIERDVSMCSRKQGKSRVFSNWMNVAVYMTAAMILSVSKSMHGRTVRRFLGL